MADLIIDEPTTKPPEAREVRLRAALDEEASGYGALKDALAQQQAKSEQLEQRLLEANHARFDHGAVAAQEAIGSLNAYREAFELEARAAFLVAKSSTMENFVDALRAALTPHIMSALARLREIESANGQSGWCRHQKRGWTANREGAVVKAPTLCVVKP